jgi:hypothetical protein
MNGSSDFRWIRNFGLPSQWKKTDLWGDCTIGFHSREISLFAAFLMKQGIGMVAIQ